MTSRSNALLWPGTVLAEVTRSQRLTVYSLCCDCTVVPRRCLSSSLGVANGGPFFHRQARRNYKSKPASRFHSSILAFTNSANRTVINWTITSTRNCEGVSCPRQKPRLALPLPAGASAPSFLPQMRRA